MFTTYLDDLVPAGRHNHGVLGVGAEADAADPVGVAVLLDGELAVTEGVPQLDGAVAAARHDLAVVRAEAHAEHIGAVADEAAGGLARVEIPETEGVVPRGRERELAVRRDDDVRHKVVVAVEDLLGVTVVDVIARELPDDDGVVARAGQQEVWVLRRRRDRGDPVSVARQASLVGERLSHGDGGAKVVSRAICTYRARGFAHASSRGVQLNCMIHVRCIVWFGRNFTLPARARSRAPTLRPWRLRSTPTK